MARAQPGGDSGVIFMFVEENQCFGILRLLYIVRYDRAVP